ncbi:restriction endonuclease [Cohnella herbarum]|uniref:Restriction endonuclease n=1 Tax=Cohnella herbarum TaxID=2728023 RepID=A0A7Z2ZNR1_9BACL|nr:restriction endonuclease [Cohnella herbarum]QJD86344.1 restriction endonuclease [Cohnella herbarum]
MAKTYASEGKEVAYILRGLFIIGGLALFFNIPGLHWGFFFGILIGAVIIAEFLGAMWATKRRSSQKRVKKKVAISTGSPAKSPSVTKLNDQQLIQANVDTLSGADFERLMEMYYRGQGYSVERIGGAGDHEVDLIIKGKEGYKIAVQCKCWKKDVGNDIVLRLKAGKQVHGCYDAWIVTTSNFTKAAKEAADRLNIKLINGLILQDKLNRWRKGFKVH